MSDRVPPEDAAEFVVDIKPADFLGAVRASASHCLVARALRRTFPDLEHVSVTTQHAELGEEEWGHDAFRVINRFDNWRLAPADLPLRVKFYR
jgi:hypothetical protein